MVEEQNPAQVNPEAEGTEPAQKERGSRKARTEPNHAKATQATSASAITKARRYSKDEKAEKLRQIEARIANGSTLKAAVKNASISEQTYYLWKRATPTRQNSKVQEPKANVAASIQTLADLVELEAENQRLRGLLAEKLRAENAELRQRLGMH